MKNGNKENKNTMQEEIMKAVENNKKQNAKLVPYDPKKIKSKNDNNDNNIWGRLKNISAYAAYGARTFLKGVVSYKTFDKTQEINWIKDVIIEDAKDLIGELTKKNTMLSVKNSKRNKAPEKSINNKIKSNNQRNIREQNKINVSKNRMSKLDADKQKIANEISDSEGGLWSQFSRVGSKLSDPKEWKMAFNSKIDSLLGKSLLKEASGMEKIDSLKDVGIAAGKIGNKVKMGASTMKQTLTSGKVFSMTKNALKHPIEATKALGKLTLKPLKLLTQFLGPINTLANADTVIRDTSNFKKLLAGADIVGDFTPLSPITSLANTVLPAIYDGLDSKKQQKLDKFAGYITDPVGKMGEMAGKIFSATPNNNNRKLPNSRKTKSTYTRTRDPRLRNTTVTNLYSRNSVNMPKAKNSITPSQSKVDSTKIIGPRIDNSIKNQNKYNININGINKSTTEIINDLIPRLQESMSNQPAYA
ncbi:hypothetical protein [Marinisporobacter balticus]|uniref:Uncharacterized protein n=1 Tax=Marinisporobacter balticus TaxID=2018667 RepID=A0A4R2L2B2_9FIRM|nr:hypothetical protein [Marinisporobacter balticus]TCO78019.1 hypothetical protein EV214_105118 [Marinisporobacter balticus]